MQTMLLPHHLSAFCEAVGLKSETKATAQIITDDFKEIYY